MLTDRQLHALWLVVARRMKYEQAGFLLGIGSQAVYRLIRRLSRAMHEEGILRDGERVWNFVSSWVDMDDARMRLSTAKALAAVRMVHGQRRSRRAAARALGCSPAAVTKLLRLAARRMRERELLLVEGADLEDVARRGEWVLYDP